MSLDKRLVCSLEGWRNVDELSIELDKDYSSVLFALERLKGYGFACENRDGDWSLTRLGVKLRDIIC